jgi:rhomboid protease GluP
MILFYWLSVNSPTVLNGGIMDSLKVSQGQWWRLFTAMMLHADLAHLAENLSLGIVLVGLAMGIYGTGTGLFAAYLAGAAGNVASLMLNAKPFTGLGASGMVMGALGLLAAQSLRRENWARGSVKYAAGGVVAGVMLFILFGLSPGTDTAAHMGGFLAGLALGTALVFAPTRWAESERLNFLSLILLVAMVTATWLVAVKHGHE